MTSDASVRKTHDFYQDFMYIRLICPNYFVVIFSLFYLVDCFHHTCYTDSTAYRRVPGIRTFTVIKKMHFFEKKLPKKFAQFKKMSYLCTIKEKIILTLILP